MENMQKEIPLYGTISHSGNMFSLHYRKHDSQSSIHKEGYDISVFDGCPADMPVIRFDLADINNVFSWLKNNYICADFSDASIGFKTSGLDVYLATFTGYSIPVEELRITRESFK